MFFSPGMLIGASAVMLNRFSGLGVGERGSLVYGHGPWVGLRGVVY